MSSRADYIVNHSLGLTALLTYPVRLDKTTIQNIWSHKIFGIETAVLNKVAYGIYFYSNCSKYQVYTSFSKTIPISHPQMF